MGEDLKMSELILKCLVVDDESIAVEGIVNNINKIEFLELKASCNSALEAGEYLKNNRVDLMFLDINMPHLTGLEFLETLENTPLVILSTAYSEYALEGFRLNVVDYLLKPYLFKRFYQAAERAKEMHQLKVAKNKEDKEETTIYIKVADTYKKLLCRDIKYVESMQNYIKIYMATETYIVHQTMSSIETSLPPQNFFRIHKSYLVNKLFVESVQGNEVRIEGVNLPLSKYRKKDLLDDLVNS